MNYSTSNIIRDWRGDIMRSKAVPRIVLQHMLLFLIVIEEITIVPILSRRYSLRWVGTCRGVVDLVIGVGICKIVAVEFA